MWITHLWLLNLSLLWAERWARAHAHEELVETRRAIESCGEGCPKWGHVDAELLERRLAGEAPVLVACKLIFGSLLLGQGTDEKLTSFRQDSHRRMPISCDTPSAMINTDFAN